MIGRFEALEFVEKFFDLFYLLLSIKTNKQSERKGADLLVLSPILISHLLPIGKVLFKGRVDEQLFTDGVTRKFPCELILPSHLFVVCGGAEDFVVRVFELAVVVRDGLRDESHGWDGGAEIAILLFDK